MQMEKETQEDKVRCLAAWDSIPARRVTLPRGMKGLCHCPVGAGTLAVPPHRMPVRGQNNIPQARNTAELTHQGESLYCPVSCSPSPVGTGRLSLVECKQKPMRKGILGAKPPNRLLQHRTGVVGLGRRRQNCYKFMMFSSFYRLILVFMVYLLRQICLLQCYYFPPLQISVIRQFRGNNSEFNCPPFNLCTFNELLVIICETRS